MRLAYLKKRIKGVWQISIPPTVHLISSSASPSAPETLLLSPSLSFLLSLSILTSLLLLLCVSFSIFYHFLLTLSKLMCVKPELLSFNIILDRHSVKKISEGGGRVAQSVEHLTFNQVVTGSNPVAPTIF